MGQVDQTAEAVGAGCPGGGEREQPDIVEQEQIILHQPGPKPGLVEVAGGDPAHGGVGELALQLWLPELEEALAQPGHAWPLQHISQKASSNRAAPVKSTPRRPARAGDGAPARSSKSRPRVSTKSRTAHRSSSRSTDGMGSRSGCWATAV